LPFAEANGVRLYYELNGDRGDPIVLIHGSWVDHTSWDLAVPNLAESFRVLTYDRRGHGRSEKTGTQGSGDEDALDASALITQLGLVPAHVVGNSFGGSVALKLAARQPSTFRSLMVHEPPLFDLLRSESSAIPMLLEEQKRIERVIRLLESGDKVGGARLFMETIILRPGMWEMLPEQLRETIVANADTWLDETRDPTSLNVDLEALAQFRKPTLLTYGGKGLRGSELIIEKLAKAIPNSRVEFDPDEGHSPHLSNPANFVRTVRAFATQSGS
jgi:pimeloyl-ACP methyl ester carboxylesterase